MSPSDLPRMPRQVNGSSPSPDAQTAGASLSLSDIYYAFFRHKWKIFLCALCGVVAAIALYRLKPPPYQSEAKLFIRYVTESRANGPSSNDSKVISPDSQGGTILNSELEIMTSLDLAKDVVRVIGANKILPKGSTDQDLAAQYLSQNFKAGLLPQSSIIYLSFKHPNPEIVQPVLREIIDQYRKKHVEIHRALGISGDFLSQQTNDLRARLALTDEELQKAQKKIGALSIEDAKKECSAQMASLRQQIFAAQGDLAKHSATLLALTGKAPATNPEPTTEIVRPSAEKITLYRQIGDRLSVLSHKEQDLLTYATPENIRVKEIREQIAAAEQAKANLEAETPGLAQINLPTATPIQTASAPSGAIDTNAEYAQVKALESQLKLLQSQLDQTRAEASNIEQIEPQIRELIRKKELEESNYRYYSASLEQTRIDEALGAGHVSNISEIQSPSPPERDEKKSRKIVGMVGISGLLLGIGWAFAIELFFDRTIKRPIDVERATKRPLFISIPKVHAATKKQLAKSGANKLLAPAPAKEAALQVSSASDHLDHDHALYPFHETLRDRLIAYFESINLTHKPKLIAVTGLNKGSGVTTIAAGLAQRFSEAEDGNVLLVDMNLGQGSAQQFSKGKPVCGLDELLDTKVHGQVHDNLYVVMEGSNSEKLSRNLPQRFTKLVPKLKASDFDYIIFDMPPVSQISVTPRLAGFMDMVLLVLESEKTDKDIVQRATALLAESKARVGVVLNKTVSYVPSRLQQEFSGDI